MSTWTARNHPEKTAARVVKVATVVHPAYSDVVLYDASGEKKGVMDATTRKRFLEAGRVELPPMQLKSAARETLQAREFERLGHLPPSPGVRRPAPGKGGAG